MIEEGGSSSSRGFGTVEQSEDTYSQEEGNRTEDLLQRVLKTFCTLNSNLHFLVAYRSPCSGSSDGYDYMIIVELKMMMNAMITMLVMPIMITKMTVFLVMMMMMMMVVVVMMMMMMMMLMVMMMLLMMMLMVMMMLLMMMLMVMMMVVMTMTMTVIMVINGEVIVTHVEAFILYHN